MKTKEVTLPPLFSRRDGNPLAAGRPSRERAWSPGRASQAWLTWEAAGLAKANSEGAGGGRTQDGSQAGFSAPGGSAAE